MKDKLELKSSHEVIYTVDVADVESIFQGKPTDPDILTVLMKDGKRLYCDEVCPIDSLQEEPVNIWHGSNKEQPKAGSNVAIWDGESGEILTRCVKVNPNRKWAYMEDLLGKKEEPVIKETNMYIFITQKIVDYIEEHKVFFENTIPTIGEKWFIEREHTYPNVNRGNPVVEVINDKGEWMRLPKDIVEIFEEPKDRCKGCVTCVDGQKYKDEFCSKDLGEYINELSKQFPEVSFAKLSRIAVRVAKWQKQQDQSTIELAEDHAMFAGMEKMKEQMMTKAIDAQCFGFQDAALFSFRLPADNYLVGSEVKVIVIKED